MSEEKKVESVEEDEKETQEEDQKLEAERTEEDKKEEFEKENELVPANKLNQALRKQREIEAEKRELEKKLAEATKEVPVVKEDDDDDDSFFNDDEEEKKKEIDPSSMMDEKLKPVLDRLEKSEKDKRRNDRDAFFDAHPEYAEDGQKFQTLLDELDNSINPNSTDSYYVQLEKTHRIIAGDYVGNQEVEDKKAEMASDASSSGDGSQTGSPKEEFTAEDKAYMKEWDISEEGMRRYKEKIASGQMQVL